MHLFTRSAPRWRASFVLAIVIVLLPCSIATAGPILLSFDVTLTEPGVFPADSDLGVAVTGGVELNNLNGTDVGALLFDDEFINVTNTATATFLAYRIYGGLDAHLVATGYSTSWQEGTTLLFSNFVLDQPGTLASVSVTASQVVGAGGGALLNPVDYAFGPTSLLLNIGSLGILDGPPPLGLMTFRLNFQADEELPADTIPDPASSLTLFGTGMAALAACRRWAGRPQ